MPLIRSTAFRCYNKLMSLILSISKVMGYYVLACFNNVQNTYITMICTMRYCKWMLSFNIKKGEEFKVPYYASTAATYDGNLLYVTATCLT